MFAFLLDAFFLLETLREALEDLPWFVGVGEAVSFVGDEVGVRDTCFCGLEDLDFILAFADALYFPGVLSCTGESRVGVLGLFLYFGVLEAGGA